MAAERALTHDRLHALGQPIEAATHVGGFRCQPDPWSDDTVEDRETRQADHSSCSSTVSSRRRWLTSKSGPTSRLRPRLSRTSISALGTGAVGSKATAVSVVLTSTATNEPASAGRKRFLH